MKNQLSRDRMRVAVLTAISILAPLGYVGWLIWDDRMGAQPIETLNKKLGTITAWLLLLNLYIGLGLFFLKKRGRIPGWVVRFRRPLGVVTFGFACLHFASFFLRDGDFQYAFEQLMTKRYLLFALGAWSLLFMLALTSNNWSVRLLTGRRWKGLHRLVYLATALAALHVLSIEKADVRKAQLYFIPLAFLQLTRGFIHWRRTQKAHG